MRSGTNPLDLNHGQKIAVILIENPFRIVQ
jgi:hypothetical protein